MRAAEANPYRHNATVRRWGALAAASIGALVLLALPSPGAGSSGDEYAVGSGSNQFLIAIGDARLSISAHRDPLTGDTSGHVRAKGDPEVSDPFTLEGEVTCLEVRGNRAAIKYRFKHAEGSAAPFEGGGVQIFVEDNGDPDGGMAVDGTTFDPPQSPELFELDANRCDDPTFRGYDQIESGDFGVRDANG